MTIPIRNLYYLFTYAWQQFPHGSSTDVGIDESPDLPNLLARLLILGTNRLLRRGLDRGYRVFTETTRSPRGRFVLEEIVKRQTMMRGEVVCTFDELTTDVLHNQIIKATARLIAVARALDPQNRHELNLLIQRMMTVSDLRLTGTDFYRVQLSRNTGLYRPLMRLCEFIFRNVLPDEHGDDSHFADILKDEVVMSAVFEEFLRNFYGHEQKDYRVGRQVLTWDAYPLGSSEQGRLPVMETDITLRSPERIVVMDAKFYKEALVSKAGPPKVRSGHLYQLFAYMEHTAIRHPGTQCDGALIYPAVGNPFTLRYQIRGHEVAIQSIDFSQPWPKIHDDLLIALSGFGRAGSEIGGLSPGLEVSAGAVSNRPQKMELPRWSS